MTIHIKPLEWITPEQDWLKADSPWGMFLICDQPMFGKPWRSFSPSGWPTYSGESREEVRQKTEADYRQRILSALEPQQEEAVAITPHMLNAGTEQITVPSYDADDKKDLAVKVFRAMILARNSAHPIPVQVQESQTVSEGQK